MRFVYVIFSVLICTQAQALTFKSGQSISGASQNQTIQQEDIEACADNNLKVSSTQTLQAMSFNIRYDNAGDGGNAWPNRQDKVAHIFKNMMSLLEACKKYFIIKCYGCKTI